MSKSPAFTSPQRPSAAAASASVPDTSRDTESEMKISMASDVTHQPSSTSLKQRQPLVMTTTTAADPVLDQLNDEVNDFHISECMSRPHFKSKTVILQLSPL